MPIEIQKEIVALRTVLLMRAPFVGSLVLKTRIVTDNTLPYPTATDGKLTIYINPELFKKFNRDEKLFVLAHETLHLALLSHQRRGSRDPLLWNIATDCVINWLLLSSGLRPPEGVITPSTISKWTGVDERAIQKMSADQIYALIAQVTSARNAKGCQYGDRIRHGDGEGEGGIGDKAKGSEGEGGIDGEEIEEFWRRAVSEAVNFAKSVGRLPNGVDIVFEILKPKINWRALLRQAVLQGPGLQVLSTWRRPHRKLPNDVPGHVRLSVNNVWCLVDVSGSMIGSHLDTVMSEVFGIAKSIHSRVNVIAWDADAYLVSFAELKAQMKIQGGGGTVIKPALELLTSKMRPNDIVVVLTDGLIYDINDQQVQRMLESIARRAASAVFASTITLPSLPPGWRGVLIT